MVGALLWLCLAAPPTNSLALVQWQSVGIEQKKVDFYSDYFAEAVGNGGRLKVATPSAIAAILGVERQKQLLGCAEDSESCLAELAGAMGTYGVISGTLAKVGSGYAVTIKVIRSADGQTLVSYSGRPVDEDGMLDFLSRSAWDLRFKITGVEEREPLPVVRTGEPTNAVVPRVAVVVPQAPGKDRRVFAVIPAAIGVGAGIASAILLVKSRGIYNQLHQGDTGFTTRESAQSAADSGNIYRGVGIGLAVTAAVGFVAAIVLVIEGENAAGSTQIGAWANPNGGGVGIAGVLP